MRNERPPLLSKFVANALVDLLSVDGPIGQATRHQWSRAKRRNKKGTESANQLFTGIMIIICGRQKLKKFPFCLSICRTWIPANAARVECGEHISLVQGVQRGQHEVLGQRIGRATERCVIFALICDRVLTNCPRILLFFLPSSRSVPRQIERRVP